MKKLLAIVIAVFVCRSSIAQGLNASDTALMLKPYLRKADTASLSNRINLAAARNLQQVTNAGNVTTHSITAPTLFAQRLTLGTTGVATPVQVGIAMNNYAAAADNQNITTFIENGEAAGSSLYAIRHNNYNGTGGYYDMFAYRMTGANSDLTIGAPIAVNFAVGGVHRMKVNSLGKVSINSNTPTQQLNVGGNMSITEGNLLINTTTDNGQTLQANGTAYITGNVGIGITPSAVADEKLRVNGLVRARKVIVTLNGWGDYVFDSAYRLKPLPEVADYIQQHHHLPEMPAAGQIEKEGLDLGSVVKQQQVKIEELTLYILSQAKKQEALQLEILALQELLAEKEGKTKSAIVKP